MFLLALLSGCGSSRGQVSALHEEISDLKKDRRQLTKIIDNLRTKIDKQSEAIASFQELGERRVTKLFFVSRVEIGKRSGGSDFDDTPGDDGIVVYLNLYDQDGHIFKAAGEIDLYVYDLFNPDDPQLIAKQQYDIDQAKALWHGRLLTYHYRIVCPWEKRPPIGREVLVKVAFLDYLTGNVLQTSQELEISQRAPLAP